MASITSYYDVIMSQWFQVRAILLSTPQHRHREFPSGLVGLKHLDATSLAWVMLSLLVFQRFKLKIVPLILLGIAFGSLRHLLGV